MAKEKTTIQMNNHVQCNQDYEIRTDRIGEKEYIVVPVVMMTEGVHNGSHGALLHNTEELGKFTDAWNGIPVTIYHPEINGNHVSANHPQVLEQFQVGRVFNTHLDASKLKAEVWIEQRKLIANSPAALQAIQNNEPLDVSVGVFNDELQEAGEWQGEQYEAVATNYRPDHLAILPGQQGACSWTDGCGIRVNNKQTKTNNNMDNKQIEQRKEAARKGLTTCQHIMQTNEQGYLALRNKIQRKLDAMDTDNRYHFLEELYSDRFVYRINNSEETEFYQREYTVSEDGSVEIGTEPVKMKIEYIQTNKNEEDTSMSENKKPCCPEKVTSLINHSLTAYTEDDREWLNGMKEEQLERMKPTADEVNTNAGTNEVTEDVVKQKLTAYAEEEKGSEKVISMLPESMQESVKTGMAAYAEKRQALEKSILDNAEKDLWSEDDLKAMDMDMLKKIEKSVTANSEKSTVTDYSANGGREVVTTNTVDEEALLPPDVVVNEENKKENK